MSKNELGVFILRGQPIHNAHISTIQKMLTECRKVLVLLGSCGEPPTIKNPFSFELRREMILSSFPMHPTYEGRLSVMATYDFMYDDDRWVAQINGIVSTFTSPQNVWLYGHDKDESTFYLEMFPKYNRVETGLIEPLNATQIRNLMFSPNFNPGFLTGVMPPNVIEQVVDFMKTSEYTNLVEEFEFIKNYKKQYESLPYPPVFVTGDAVVTMKGHVALIKRKASPGRGLWALPGGFLNANTDKSVKDCAIRELKEETRIKIPPAALKGMIVNERVFDNPGRSLRGRTITHAFHIKLTEEDFPKLRAADDAEDAAWVPYQSIRRDNMFDDHWHIIDAFVGI